MDCEQVKDQIVALLPEGEEARLPEPVARHLSGCRSCREEADTLSRTWMLLGQWPETAPRDEVGARLLRSIRRQLLRESVLTVQGWVPAVLASVIGVGLSLVLSLLVPYSLLVSLCREALQVADPHAAPYLLAGMAYGLPLALSVWIIRRRAMSGALIGSLEASLLFLVILAPYVIAQCREFAPALQVVFLSGLGGGAVVASLAGLWLAWLAPFGKIRA